MEPIKGTSAHKQQSQHSEDRPPHLDRNVVLVHPRVAQLGRVARPTTVQVSAAARPAEDQQLGGPDYASHLAAQRAARERSEERAVAYHVEQIEEHIEATVGSEASRSNHETLNEENRIGRQPTLENPTHRVRRRTPIQGGFGISRWRRDRTPTRDTSTRVADLQDITNLTMTATTPARTGVSPSSSPRLPSPPPFTEVQFGPQSPTVGDASSEFNLGDIARPDEGAARRIRPGTRAADMRSGPPLVPLSQVLHAHF